jgi:hypothetical protein
MELVQVGADNYVCLRVKSDPIKRGEVVAIDDDAVAKALLESYYEDSANNQHPYFVTTDDRRAQKYAVQRAEAVKPARRRRTPTEAPPTEESDAT